MQHGSELASWASKAGGGGTGVASPAVEKISGGRPPRNDDISVSFFLAHRNFLHFLQFSK